MSIVRSGAYRLLRAVQAHGDGALRDGRHGHPSKVREPIRAWLAVEKRRAALE